MAIDQKAVTDTLSKQVVYDGEGYTREGLEKMLGDYQAKNTTDLQKFGELSDAYSRLSKEMSADIAGQKTVMEYLSAIFAFRQIGANVKGLLAKLPLLGGFAPSRDLKELLGEKIEIAQTRVKEVGNYLDALQSDIKNLQNDITRLNKKMLAAAHNEEKAASYVLELEDLRKKVEAGMASMDPKSSEARELAARIDELKRAIWEHGAKLRLYSNAEDRLSAIVKMNNNFLEIMTNLHGNMTSLYESGNEVLNELHGNLAGLASISKAGELSVEMHRSMESLKKSVNKLATLASDTSLFLAKNVDRMTAEMKIYDAETEALVESNLKAEREIKESRINETIELARKERGGKS
ncbi:MAG: hypothetical protein HY748_05725 [Elusimicrobia bacterium]|nr:hypothetical protein [Elusimicrobiota bacterium]